jgi:hypothetical protein
MFSPMSSWNRIVVPFTQEISPDLVKIGEMGWDCYRRANEPQGFAMFHASEGPGDGEHDKWIVYLTPVASEVCREISEAYTFEPCKPPARDEPNMAYVFGDPRMMAQLRDSVDTDELVVS